MVEMKKIGIVITLTLFITGCAASSKTVRPTSAPEQTGAVIHEQVVPGPFPAIEQPVVETAPEIQDVSQTAQPITGQPIGIAYSQITNLISEFIDVQPVETTSGEPMFLGTSENNLVILEIIGDKDNISQASMKLAYPKDIVTMDADLNRAMMLRFLRNAVPEFEDWPGRVSDIVSKFDSMAAESREESRIAFDGKIIDIIYDKDTESITVTVRHRNN